MKFLQEMVEIIVERSIDQQLDAARKEVAKLKAKMDMSPHAAKTLEDQYKRQVAAIKALSQKKDLRARGEDSKAETNKWHKDNEEARNSRTKDEKKQQVGKAISQGHQSNAAKREEAGGHEGMAGKFLAYVNKASEGGKHKISGADIAHHFDINTRTVNKWLERPEFAKVRMRLGR